MNTTCVDEMVDFFYICEDEKGKYLDPQYYYYYTEDPEDPETPGRCVYYHRYIYLEDFIAMSSEEKHEWLAETVKYIDDLTEEETEKWYEASLAEFPDELSFEDITLDTPCGNYHTNCGE